MACINETLILAPPPRPVTFNLPASVPLIINGSLDLQSEGTIELYSSNVNIVTRGNLTLNGTVHVYINKPKDKVTVQNLFRVDFPYFIEIGSNFTLIPHYLFSKKPCQHRNLTIQFIPILDLSNNTSVNNTSVNNTSFNNTSFNEFYDFKPNRAKTSNEGREKYSHVNVIVKLKRDKECLIKRKAFIGGLSGVGSLLVVIIFILLMIIVGLYVYYRKRIKRLKAEYLDLFKTWKAQRGSFWRKQSIPATPKDFKKEIIV